MGSEWSRLSRPGYGTDMSTEIQGDASDGLTPKLCGLHLHPAAVADDKRVGTTRDVVW